MDPEMQNGSRFVAVALNKVFELKVNGVALRFVPESSQVKNVPKCGELNCVAFVYRRITEMLLNDYAYTLAFEDHGDANNFWFLLESFFEDLGDFKADIIPLPVKLCAGQPFVNVEMASQPLVEGNQID
ncbi:hypothetical protein FEM48_Zijuj08G0195800 [Ziziphus jujuba var. spinosa]|uniref:Uncharacterized protein n=1 Tax=Ziziphus jujuba var. spinosa TaxID=714518 RepID=A0A978V0Z4_ZIZJJ|nr:hypothetical protein FEM48_Zijuj08G0195800 [Ziziphus jujuba var. spinosa]